MNDLLERRPLTVVSNRLPIRMVKEAEKGWVVSPSPGGLVTALDPVLKRQRGKWIGWIGTESDDEVPTVLEKASEQYPYDLISVPLSEEDEQLYYRGYSNETIWPLFHDLIGYCKFERDTWDRYKEINKRFAEYTARNIDPESIVWLHDYQLLAAGHYLREAGVKNPLLFFLHIPFPSPDLMRRLPQEEELIKSLVSYDLLGFQTRRDRDNFVHSVCEVFPDIGVREREEYTTLFIGDRRVNAGNWPISIDFTEFYAHTKSKEVADAAWLFHEHFPNQRIILGIDRLDYTKGIPERFHAFELFLEKYPEMHGQVILYQVLVPSRTHVPDYQNLKNLIESEVGRINGKYSQAQWVPIHYAYRSLGRMDLLAHYRAAEIALVTPLRDGMNLVAKEYCTSCVDNRGVLILSKFAGAHDELGEFAISVNPFDTERTADAIHEAITMPEDERIRRISALRDQVRNNDVHRWVERILQAGELTTD